MSTTLTIPTWEISPPDRATETSDPIDVRFEAEPVATHHYGEPVPFEFAFDRLPGESRADIQARYERLRGYERVAGEFATGTDLRGRPWYREQHGTDESALCRITPPDWLAAKGARGLWGLVDTVEDRTSTPLTAYRIGLDVLYLAGLDEYGTHAAVRNAIEANGI